MKKPELSPQQEHEDYFAGVHPRPYVWDAVGCPKCEHEDARKCHELRYGFARRKEDVCECGCHEIDSRIYAEYLPLK